MLVIFFNNTPNELGESIDADITFKEFMQILIGVTMLFLSAYIIAQAIFLSETRIWLYTTSSKASYDGLCYLKEAKQDGYISPWEKLIINLYITKE